jgi:hypothetical protein
MNDIIKGLRLLLGVPMLSILIIISGEAITKNTYAPWNPIDFFIGFGLAIVVKGIELLIRYYTFWLNTGGVGSFKDYEERK